MDLYRKTWAEIDRQAILHNVRQVKQGLSEGRKLFAVVKANGYGHGAREVAKAALEAGADYLAVALFEEALELRESGIEAPILVFGYVGPEAATLAAEKNITLTVFHLDWLKEVSLEENLHIHLKLDTGMGRLGLRGSREVKEFLAELAKQERIVLSGVYTHFATADDLDLDQYTKQKEVFKNLLEVIQKEKKDLCIHAANSAATLREPDQIFTAVRLGVSMYGLYPSESIKEVSSLHLKPAFSLHSELSHVKRLKKGSPVSYGATYWTEEDEWIGTVPIGYADGYRRGLQDSEVLIEGKRSKIVGRICMDQLMIKLDQYYDIGTKVTLIGVQGNEEITAEEIAEKLDTINYEIPCMITSRVPRLMKNDW